MEDLFGCEIIRAAIHKYARGNGSHYNVLPPDDIIIINSELKKIKLILFHRETIIGVWVHGMPSIKQFQDCHTVGCEGDGGVVMLPAHLK